MIGKLLIMISTCIMLLVIDSVVHPVPQGEANTRQTENSDENIDDLFFDRLLLFDDDRHNNGPDEGNASNSPTILGYTKSPSSGPTALPSPTPSQIPTKRPSSSPSLLPTPTPTSMPSFIPSVKASTLPSSLPSLVPTLTPSNPPTMLPSIKPSQNPTSIPSKSPSKRPSSIPSNSPSTLPSDLPSLLPSNFPSILPTDPPSLLPSNSPSTLPTDLPSLLPSTIPSFIPSLDPCKGYGGEFGNVDGDVSISISFTYGVESDNAVQRNMTATLSDQVREVEQALLDLLIGEFFQYCDNTPIRNRSLYRHNIFDGGGLSTADFVTILNVTNATNATETPSSSPSRSPTRMDNPRESEIVGLLSSPIDLANGQKCIGDFKNNPQFDTECNVIKGKMTVYLSDESLSNRTTSAMKREIKSIMDNDLLDDCHPAIMSVIYVTQSLTVKKVPTDDDFFEEETILTPAPRMMWMLVLIGMMGVMTLAASTRYRYSAQFKDDGSGELRYLSDNPYSDGFIDGEESFIEIHSSDSRIGNDMAEF